MSKFICDGEKYELAGRIKLGIGMPVHPNNLPEQIEANGYTLVSKDSFHVSLVCIGKIIEEYKLEIPEFMEKVTSDFCMYVKDNPIEFLNYRDEFRFVKKDEKKSVIVMCDIKNIEGFFDLINSKYNLNLEHPPMHVTLFTMPTNTGIYVLNSNDINTKTKIIKSPMDFKLL